MNRVMLCKHRKSRRRYLVLCAAALVLSHFIVFLMGGLRGFDKGFSHALTMVEQQIRKNSEEQAGTWKNVQDGHAGNAPGAFVLRKI